MSDYKDKHEDWQPGHRNTQTSVEQRKVDTLTAFKQRLNAEAPTAVADPIEDPEHRFLRGSRFQQEKENPFKLPLHTREQLEGEARALRDAEVAVYAASSPVRTFSTGATRDTSEGKNDYEGFLSPLVIEAYGDYMQEHQRQSDGSIRPSDNWQKGMPFDVYMKSLLRHVIDFWKLHRGYSVKAELRGGVWVLPTKRTLLCSILFNAMGYLHELLKAEPTCNCESNSRCADCRRIA